MNGWLALIRERFPPASYLPMLTVFVAGNAAAADSATGAAMDPVRLAGAFGIALSFFFRLRCFDEVKDYRTDLQLNPARPLPRGVLGVPQVLRAVRYLAVAELAASALFGGWALAAHAVAVGYSFLMYREFFIGDRLRPHLTTYAVAHTFVSVPLGLSIMVMTSGAAATELPRALVAFGGINWGLFNLFEFARKTFAADEERPGVDSYSSQFRPLGAVLLSLSQVAGALALVWLLSPAVLPTGAAAWHAMLASLFAVCAVFFAAHRGRRSASILRGSAGLYIVACYALMSVQLWG